MPATEQHATPPDATAETVRPASDASAPAPAAAPRVSLTHRSHASPHRRALATHRLHAWQRGPGAQRLSSHTAA